MPDQHHPPARRCVPSPPMIAGSSRERAVAGQRHEIVGQPGDIVVEMRPLGMSRDLRLLPRRQLGIGVAQQLRRPWPRACRPRRRYRSEPLLAVSRNSATRGVELGDRLFKIEIGQHSGRAGRTAAASRQRPRSASGWRRVDQLNQPRAVDMGVNLRRGDVGVAKQRLQHAQVGAARQQVRGERVAQDMRADPVGRNAGVARPFAGRSGTGGPGSDALAAGKQPQALAPATCSSHVRPPPRRATKSAPAAPCRPCRAGSGTAGPCAARRAGALTSSLARRPDP